MGLIDYCGSIHIELHQTSKETIADTNGKADGSSFAQKNFHMQLFQVHYYLLLDMHIET